MNRSAPFIALLVVAASAACGAGMPQTACASNPDLTTQAEVDACRGKVRDAGVDVMHVIVVDATISPTTGGNVHGSPAVPSVDAGHATDAAPTAAHAAAKDGGAHG